VIEYVIGSESEGGVIVKVGSTGETEIAPDVVWMGGT
jgi:hypothetical protein